MTDETTIVSDFVADNNLIPPIILHEDLNLNEKAESIYGNSSIEMSSMKRMLHIWYYKLIYNLDDESKELLKLFNHPKHPKTDEEFAKVVISLKIIDHCTSSVEFINVAMLGASMLLAWFLRVSRNFVGENILGLDLTLTEAQKKWAVIMDRKGDLFLNKLTDENNSKKFKQRYLFSKVKGDYENVLKNQTEIQPINPFYSIVSEIANCLMLHFKDIYFDPEIRLLPKQLI
jgi:hypothetical protein